MCSVDGDILLDFRVADGNETDSTMFATITFGVSATVANRGIVCCRCGTVYGG